MDTYSGLTRTQINNGLKILNTEVMPFFSIKIGEQDHLTTIDFLQILIQAHETNTLKIEMTVVHCPATQVILTKDNNGVWEYQLINPSPLSIVALKTIDEILRLNF